MTYMLEFFCDFEHVVKFDASYVIGHLASEWHKKKTEEHTTACYFTLPAIFNERMTMLARKKEIEAVDLDSLPVTEPAYW